MTLLKELLTEDEQKALYRSGYLHRLINQLTWQDLSEMAFTLMKTEQNTDKVSDGVILASYSINILTERAIKQNKAIF